MLAFKCRNDNFGVDEWKEISACDAEDAAELFAEQADQGNGAGPTETQEVMVLIGGAWTRFVVYAQPDIIYRAVQR